MKKTIGELRTQAKNIKIIFFDIDETLRMKDEEWMPPSVTGVFERLHKNGFKTGIASGRAYFGIVPEVIGLGADFYVTINGQYVEKSDRTVIAKQPIPRDVIERVVDWARTQQIEYGMVGSTRAAVSKWDKWTADAITVVYGVLPVDPDFWKTDEIYQMWTFTDRPLDDPADRGALPADLQKYVRLVRWHPYSCDLVPVHGSKAEGIAKVLQTLKLSPDELMVFGDGLNDIEMFDYAGFPVAMGNGHDDIKARAAYVTKRIDEDGIQSALETLGMI